jgi:hypothetical protein
VKTETKNTPKISEHFVHPVVKRVTWQDSFKSIVACPRNDADMNEIFISAADIMNHIFLEASTLAKSPSKNYPEDRTPFVHPVVKRVTWQDSSQSLVAWLDAGSESGSKQLRHAKIRVGWKSSSGGVAPPMVRSFSLHGVYE